jgi:hypothetical protein
LSGERQREGGVDVKYFTFDVQANLFTRKTGSPIGAWVFPGADARNASAEGA